MDGVFAGALPCSTMPRASSFTALVLLLAGAAVADEGFAQRLPDFHLKDPAGREHTRAELLPKGLVLVVTAPTVDNEDDQRGWDEELQKARPAGAEGRLVFVEDLSASWVPGLALQGMKREFRDGVEPLLVVDEEGALRRALHVERGKTVVLVYDAAGKLVHDETGDPAAHRAARSWAALPAPAPPSAGVRAVRR